MTTYSQAIILICGPLILVAPVLAWIGIGRFAYRTTRVWYAACFALACVYILLVARPFVPGVLSYNFAQTLKILSLCMLIYALKVNLGEPLVHKKFFTALLLANAGIYQILRANVDESTVVIYNQILFIWLDGWVLWKAWLLSRKYESRGAILICLGAVVIEIAYLLRVAAQYEGVGVGSLALFGWDTSSVVLAGIIDLLCKNVGFFGFVLEKANQEKRQAELSSLQSKIKLEGSMLREAELGQLVHERDEMLRMLSHESRVSTLETLSSNLSHEINQPLATILLNAETARSMLAEDSLDRAELTETLDAVISENKRATQIVQRIRDLAKNKPITMQMFELLPVVETALGIIKADLDQKGLCLSYDPTEFQRSVYGDPLLLNDVLLNLIKNAAESLMQSPHADRCIVLRCEVVAGEMVVVEVADNGVGIPEEVAQHVFDPFFTTKEAGLGLGLALSRSIMSRMLGDLRFEQASGWTKFRISMKNSVVNA